jgi:hypothetical protein
MTQDVSNGAARIVSRLDELNGASDDEGALTRLTLSPAHARAAAMVRAWMEEAGLAVRLDSVGNVVGRREGARPGVKTLIIGSHIDSVRNAGRFDGPLGVILGIEACARLAARGKAPSVRDRGRCVRRRGGRALSNLAHRLARAGGNLRSRLPRKRRRAGRLAPRCAARLRLRSLPHRAGSARSRQRARLCRTAHRAGACA